MYSVDKKRLVVQINVEGIGKVDLIILSDWFVDPFPQSIAVIIDFTVLNKLYEICKEGAVNKEPDYEVPCFLRQVEITLVDY